MLTRGREAQARASPDTVLSPLPRCFVRAVFLLLPADQRLRCIEVSRAWRALLADTSFFTCLNLSTYINSGVARFSEALFHAAIAKAGGQLRELDVFGETVSFATLLDALASNAATLELLDASSTTWYTPAEVEETVRAAPLSVLRLCANADNLEQARRYLRNDSPYGQLRLHGIVVVCEGQLDSLDSLEALCADLLKHPSLAIILIRGASLGTAAAMRFLVSAAIELQVNTVALIGCGCARACVPELTRLVSAGAIEQMVIENFDVELFEAGADTDQFCAAVRASASLERLELNHCGPSLDAAAAAAFIEARDQ